MLKDIVKKFVGYHIEGDYNVYTVKHTPVKVKLQMTRRFNKKWGGLPIQPDKIVFDNYMGSGYGCNGKYITESLLRSGRHYDIVWTVKDVRAHSGEFPEGVRLVEYMSDEAFYEYATAKMWVCNIHLVPYLFKGLRKKEGQYYIQTWHGSLGIKKIENQSTLIRRAQNWLTMAALNSHITDYWISNSDFETNVYKTSFWGVKDDAILMYGHPRNDILISDTNNITEKVGRVTGISKETKTALYVPTFRDNSAIEGFTLDYEGLRDSLVERYGGTWRILIRIHPKMKERARDIVPQKDFITDVTDYEDVQELLLFADVLITDYSSCMFDFMLTGKPVFVYATDASGYDGERGLYYPLTDTPFPVAEDNDQLFLNIKDFDGEKYRERSDEFLRGKGVFEDGQAAGRVADLVDKLINNSKERKEGQ